jgi:hypothetical protein
MRCTVQATTIKLYRFDDSSNLWALEAASVNPHFYNVNEDSASAKPKWYIEVADAEIEVSDQFNFEESGLRVIFQGEAIWALRFPNAQSYQDFHNLYNDKLFENTFGLENDEANRQKVKPFPPHISTIKEPEGTSASTKYTTTRGTPTPSAINVHNIVAALY